MENQKIQYSNQLPASSIPTINIKKNSINLNEKIINIDPQNPNKNLLNVKILNPTITTNNSTDSNINNNVVNITNIPPEKNNINQLNKIPYNKEQKPISKNNEIKNFSGKIVRKRPSTFLFGRKKILENNPANKTFSYPSERHMFTIEEEKNQISQKTTNLNTQSGNNYPYVINRITIKPFNPHVITAIYIRKMNEINDIYSFITEYFSFTLKILNKLSDIYISCLANIFINYIKPNIKYYQGITGVYRKFFEEMNSLNLIHSNNIAPNNKNKNLIKDEIRLADKVKSMNILFSENFGTIVNNITKLNSFASLNEKLEIIENNFNDYNKKIKIILLKIEHRRFKILTKYNKDVAPLFTTLNQLFNIGKFAEKSPFTTDLIFIEYNFVGYCNKSFKKLSSYLISVCTIFKEAEKIINDYYELLENVTKIFYKQNIIILDKNLFESNNPEKKGKEDIKIKKRFMFNKIIETNNIDIKLYNEINHLLLNCRDFLIQSFFIKDKSKIKDVLYFNLISYNSSENFINFLLEIIPEKNEIKLKNLTQLKTRVKRRIDSINRVAKWKNCILLSTYQGHIFIFDEDDKKLKKNSSLNEKKENNTNLKIDISQSLKTEINYEIESEDDDDDEEISLDFNSLKLVYSYYSNATVINVFGDSKIEIFCYSPNYAKMQYVMIDTITKENLNKIEEIFKSGS